MERFLSDLGVSRLGIFRFELTKYAFMRIGIIFYRDTENLGDDVQTVAIERLVQSIVPQAELVWTDRESLHETSTSQLDALIITGWFMENPLNWPPKSEAPTLLISFHISNFKGAKQQMTSPESIAYLKKHEPIGCRDFNTLNILSSVGVNCYYSGCATLTLQAEDNWLASTKSTLLIDPFYTLNAPLLESELEKQLVSRGVSNESRSLSCSVKGLNQLSIEERRNNVITYLKSLYAANQVITARIHAAMPAASLGTPVLFSKFWFDSALAQDRFHGTTEFFPSFGTSSLPFASKTNVVHRLIRKIPFLHSLFHLSKWEKRLPQAAIDGAQIEAVRSKLRSRVSQFTGQLSERVLVRPPSESGE